MGRRLAFLVLLSLSVVPARAGQLRAPASVGRPAVPLAPGPALAAGLELASPARFGTELPALHLEPLQPLAAPAALAVMDAVPAAAVPEARTLPFSAPAGEAAGARPEAAAARSSPEEGPGG